MHTVLIVVHLMIVLALVVVVLLQRSEGGALGIGGGGGGGFMSGRGKANALTLATSWLAAGFFATSIALAIMAGTDRIAPSIIQRAAPPGNNPAPVLPSEGGLLDSLKKQQPGAEAPAPAAPAAPSAPISGAQ